MTVPLLDLTRQYQAIGPQIEIAATELLRSGAYILGPAVDDFEAQCARSIGVGHTIGVANGTDALQIALQAMGIGRGDEVITTPFSFFATAEVVSQLGAKPVFVDIEADTFNIDPQQIEAAITPRTKAIIPVHLFGHPAAMNEILAIARRHDLRVLEDAAQAWGASLQMDDFADAAAPQSTLKCGAMGDMASFSFYPTKNLGACGDAGLISTHNLDWAEHARVLRVHGSRQRYFHQEIGYNSRLDALQAAILSIKLPLSDTWNQARRAHAAAYREALCDTPFGLPSERSGARHVYHQYTIRVPEAELKREKIESKLRECGIGFAIFYPVCLHLQRVYDDLGYREGSLPVAEAAAREVLSLPMFPELRAEERDQVVQALRKAL